RLRLLRGAAGHRPDPAPGAATDPADARPGEGCRPALAERRPRALLRADAVLRRRGRPRSRAVLGGRPGWARLDLPLAPESPLERRPADHGTGLPPLVAPGARPRDGSAARGPGPRDRSRGPWLPRDRPGQDRRAGPGPAHAPRDAPAPGAVARRARRLSGHVSRSGSRSRVQRPLPRRREAPGPARARAQLQLLERGSGKAEPAGAEHLHTGRRRRSAPRPFTARPPVDRHRRADTAGVD